MSLDRLRFLVGCEMLLFWCWDGRIIQCFGNPNHLPMKLRREQVNFDSVLVTHVEDDFIIHFFWIYSYPHVSTVSYCKVWSEIFCKPNSLGEKKPQPPLFTKKFVLRASNPKSIAQAHLGRSRFHRQGDVAHVDLGDQKSLPYFGITKRTQPFWIIFFHGANNSMIHNDCMFFFSRNRFSPPKKFGWQRNFIKQHCWHFWFLHRCAEPILQRILKTLPRPLAAWGRICCHFPYLCSLTHHHLLMVVQLHKVMSFWPCCTGLSVQFDWTFDGRTAPSSPPVFSATKSSAIYRICRCRRPFKWTIFLVFLIIFVRWIDTTDNTESGGTWTTGPLIWCLVSPEIGPWAKLHVEDDAQLIGRPKSSTMLPNGWTLKRVEHPWN